VLGIFVILAAYALVFTIITRAATGQADRAPIVGGEYQQGGEDSFYISMGGNSEEGGGQTSGTRGGNVPTPGGGSPAIPVNDLGTVSLNKRRNIQVPTPQDQIVGDIKWTVNFPDGIRKTAAEINGMVFPFSSKQVGVHDIRANYLNADNQNISVPFKISVVDAPSIE